MWFKKLRHKKTQFIAAGVILFVSALIFSASLGFTAETGRFGAEYYNRAGVPNLFVVSNDERTINAVRDTMPGAAMAPVTGVQLTEAAEHNGVRFNALLSVFPMEDYTEISWDIEPKTGDLISKGPKPGEIWIPRVWADIKGIKAGDTLILQGDEPFRVGALINSYLNPSSVIAFYQFFVNHDDMGRFKDLPPAVIAPLYITGDMDEAQTLLMAAIQEHQGVMFLNHKGMVQDFTTTAMVMGYMGLLSALLVFAVAVVVIRFMLRANLLKEYRSIGIYKAQGFSNRQIRGFYLNCYAFIGAISMLLGVLAGIPTTAVLCQMGMKYVGDFGFNPMIFQLAGLSFALLFILLIVSVFLATRPIKKITPVDALRIGIASTKAKLKRPFMQNARTSLSMAVNDLFRHKGYSMMILLILFISFYLTLFFLSMKVTIEEMSVNCDTWFSVPKTDVYVTGKINNDLIRQLESDGAVEQLIIAEGFPPKTSVALDERYGYADKVIALLYDDFSLLPYTQGRAPQAVNETAVDAVLLHRLGLQVGDYISLSIKSEKSTFLITGAYESMAFQHKSIHLISGSLPACGVEFIPGLLMVMLNENISHDMFINELNRKYNGILAEDKLAMVIESTAGIRQMISPVTLIMIAAFIIFSILNTCNLLTQDHANNRRQYGILKALGFSTAYITARNTWRVFLLAFAAALVSLLSHILFSPRLFSAFIINALNLAIPGSLLMMVSLLILLIAVTLLSCIPIRGITPIELMEE